MGGTEFLVQVTVLLLARFVWWQQDAVLQAGRVYSRGEVGFPRLGSAAHRTPQECGLCAANKGERCESLQPATGSPHPTRFSFWCFIFCAILPSSEILLTLLSFLTLSLLLVTGIVHCARPWHQLQRGLSTREQEGGTPV